MTYSQSPLSAEIEARENRTSIFKLTNTIRNDVVDFPEIWPLTLEDQKLDSTHIHEVSNKRQAIQM
jgi:hypothetical protein